MNLLPLIKLKKNILFTDDSQSTLNSSELWLLTTL